MVETKVREKNSSRYRELQRKGGAHGNARLVYMAQLFCRHDEILEHLELAYVTGYLIREGMDTRCYQLTAD